MSRPVDVLAVMAEVIKRTEAQFPTPLNRPGESNMHPAHFCDYLWEIKQARAAVAELVAASIDALEAVKAMAPYGVTFAPRDRLTAALAKFGSAA